MDHPFYMLDWLNYMDSQRLEKYADALLQCKTGGIPIEPEPSYNTVFRCFSFFKPQDTKVVLLGQDPYPDGSATGLAFANRADKNPISQSLRVLKDSVLSLVDSKESPIFDQTLESWAKQGILLLNSALTVKRGQPGSHTEAWKPFIERLITGLSADTNCCFLLFGKQAWEFTNCIFDKERGVFYEYHPAYYSRCGKQMPGDIWKKMFDYVSEVFGTTIKLYE